MLFYNRFFIFLFTLFLTVLSSLIVWQNINDEPYILFRKSDMFFQVGLSSVLLTLWLQLAIFLVVGSLKKWLPSFYLVLLLWIIMNCFLLGFAMVGYLGDLEGKGICD
jgi:hypothetical protein